MTRMFVKAKIQLAKALEEREAGQGTLEYLGVVIVAAVLVIAAIAAFNGLGLGDMVGEKLQEVKTQMSGFSG